MLCANQCLTDSCFNPVISAFWYKRKTALCYLETLISNDIREHWNPEFFINPLHAG